MKLKKILAVIMVAVIGMTLFAGCNSRKDNLNGMNMDEVERLPEAQKDTELDKTLAQMRKFRTDSYKSENGGATVMTMVDSELPGQTKNRPDFSTDMNEVFYEFIHEYLKNEVGVTERNYGYDVEQCMDPRMNAIYDDDDKGVAAGYENENILLMEYQTFEDSVYSYLVLVRESKESPWKVIHDGLSYKE
ncbi:MAG: hypothetical protein RR444_10885 [Oscillospiraceae bacterium]